MAKEKVKSTIFVKSKRKMGKIYTSAAAKVK